MKNNKHFDCQICVPWSQSGQQCGSTGTPAVPAQLPWILQTLPGWKRSSLQLSLILQLQLGTLARPHSAHFMDNTSAKMLETQPEASVTQNTGCFCLSSSKPQEPAALLPHPWGAGHAGWLPLAVYPVANAVVKPGKRASAWPSAMGSIPTGDTQGCQAWGRSAVR